MIEKVNPSHPDKLADRIAGAIVDFAYQTTGAFTSSNDPKIAVEVLLGHGKCDVIIETDTDLDKAVIKNIIYRTTNVWKICYKEYARFIFSVFG